MAADVYRFTWSVNKAGYHWAEGGAMPHGGRSKKKLKWMLTSGSNSAFMVPPYTATKIYSPLTEFPGLYRTFCSLPFADREAILAFANKYGLLGITLTLPPEGSTSRPESIRFMAAEGHEEWARAIEHLRQAVKLWDLFAAGDVDAISHYIRWARLEPVDDESGRIKSAELWGYKSDWDAPDARLLPGYIVALIDPVLDLFRPGDVLMPAYFLVQRWVNQHLEGQVAPHLLYDLERSNPALQIVPKNLLSAMWLQLARTIEGNKEFRACKECGRWFDISHRQADGRTKRREFCSDACKSKDYRKRRDRK